MLFSYHKCTHHEIDPTTKALEIKSLSVCYSDHDSIQALYNINIDVTPGKRVALVGSNGAGKSTLLKSIAGLITYQKGSISIFGHLPNACQHQVSYLPQQGQIDWAFPVTLERFIMTGRYVHLGWFKNPTKKDYLLLEQNIQLLQLSELKKRTINQLSGGERQRALLARTLIHNAQLILLDEPLNAIDNATQAIIHQTLTQLHKEGKTLLMATHDTEMLDKDFDQVIYLHEGRQYIKN